MMECDTESKSNPQQKNVAQLIWLVTQGKSQSNVLKLQQLTQKFKVPESKPYNPKDTIHKQFPNRSKSLSKSCKLLQVFSHGRQDPLVSSGVSAMFITAIPPPVFQHRTCPHPPLAVLVLLCLGHQQLYNLTLQLQALKLPAWPPCLPTGTHNLG